MNLSMNILGIMCTLAPCRSTVGRQSTPIDRLSVDSRSNIDRQSTDCRPTIDRLSTDRRPTVDRQSTDSRSMCQPTVGLYFLTDSRPTVDRQSVLRMTVGRQSVDCRPTACQWRWLGVMILARKGANSELYFMWGWEKCIVCKKESSWWNIRSR